MYISINNIILCEKVMLKLMELLFYLWFKLVEWIWKLWMFQLYNIDTITSKGSSIIFHNIVFGQYNYSNPCMCSVIYWVSLLIKINAFFKKKDNCVFFLNHQLPVIDFLIEFNNYFIFNSNHYLNKLRFIIRNKNNSDIW